MSSAQLAFGLLSITSSLKLFTYDRLLRMRDITGGISVVPLYIGKLLASGYEILCLPVSFLSGYYPFVYANGKLSDYLRLYMLLFFAIQGLGNLIACLFVTRTNSLIANGVIVVFWAFGGISPPISDIEERMGPLLIITYLSPFRWSFRLNSYLELDSYSPSWDQSIQDMFDSLHWPNRNDNLICEINLVLYGLFTNLIAVVMLNIQECTKLQNPAIGYIKYFTSYLMQKLSTVCNYLCSGNSQINGETIKEEREESTMEGCVQMNPVLGQLYESRG